MSLPRLNAISHGHYSLEVDKCKAVHMYLFWVCIVLSMIITETNCMVDLRIQVQVIEILEELRLCRLIYVRTIFYNHYLPIDLPNTN